MPFVEQGAPLAFGTTVHETGDTVHSRERIHEKEIAVSLTYVKRPNRLLHEDSVRGCSAQRHLRSRCTDEETQVQGAGILYWRYKKVVMGSVD